MLASARVLFAASAATLLFQLRAIWLGKATEEGPSFVCCHPVGDQDWAPGIGPAILCCCPLETKSDISLCLSLSLCKYDFLFYFLKDFFFVKLIHREKERQKDILYSSVCLSRSQRQLKFLEPSLSNPPNSPFLPWCVFSAFVIFTCKIYLFVLFAVIWEFYLKILNNYLLFRLSELIFYRTK